MQTGKLLKTSCLTAALVWAALPATTTFSAEDTSALIQALNDKINLGGVIEVEAFTGSDYAGTDSSDITLATIELGIEAQINKWVSGNLVLLWEEDDTEPVDLDVASITIGNLKVCPSFLTAGRIYMPFGAFETNMISDTLPLEIGEASDTGIILGYEMSGLYGSAYAFNGDVNETGEDDGVKSFGVRAGYGFENDNMSIDAGIDWINNISNSDGLSDALPEEIEARVAGIAVHLVASFGPFSFMAEHVAAQDEYNVAELVFRNQGAQPTATAVEAAFGFEAINREAVVAVSYQTTSEAMALELPETRLLISAGMGIYENTSLAIEYLRDEDYGTNDGGTGETADQVTAQLAVEF